MWRFYKISIVLVLLLITACNEDYESRPYPRVRTHSATVVSGQGALFIGEITNSSVEIIDHGFVWSQTSNPRIPSNKFVSLGNKSSVGAFEQLVASDLNQGETYYVAAYARSDKYVVYGDVLKFTR